MNTKGGPLGMISFLCSHCGAQLRVKPELAGMAGKCPRCGRGVEVPSDSEPGGPGRSSGARPQHVATTREPRATLETVSNAREHELDFLAPAQSRDELGRLGKYRVLKILGRGGMGIVFQAEDITLKRAVALKVMNRTQAANEVNRKRFRQEAEATAAIEHDHIVTIYEVDEDRGVPYIAMKLLLGETLEDRLNRETSLPADEVYRIGQEIALGLAEAHERGLIHRDIKPANIWLEEGTKRVKIVDFGLARACGEDVKLTQDNYLVGTPMYMSPEQAEGDRELDPRSDLFSLGGVLYRCATGELPFKGKNTMQVLTALATKKARPPIAINPNVPAPLSDMIMTLLRKDPDARPRNARAVIVALQDAADAPDGYEEVEEEDTTEEEKALDTPAERPRKKRRRPVARPRRQTETTEEKLARRVITFGIIAAIGVVLLLGALIVQRTFFPFTPPQ